MIRGELRKDDSPHHYVFLLQFRCFKMHVYSLQYQKNIFVFYQIVSEKHSVTLNIRLLQIEFYDRTQMDQITDFLHVFAEYFLI